MTKLAKKEKGSEHIKAALDSILDAVELPVLYERIHGHLPDPMEEKRFYNRFRAARSNPGVGFIGVCIANCPEIQDVTLSEFFRIDGDKSAKK